jgi:hypothetical protein
VHGPKKLVTWRDQLVGPEVKRIMLRIAVSYIALAQMANKRDQGRRGD